MARVIPHPRFRFEKSKQKFCLSKTQARRALGVVCAAFLYFLTGALVLFGAAALANADDGSARRVHAELTPSFGLSAGFNSQRASEPGKLAEVQPASQAPANAKLASVAELDALQGDPQCVSTPEIDRLKLEIAALASSIDGAQKSAKKTTLSIVGSKSDPKDDEERQEVEVVEQDLDELDPEAQDGDEELAETEEEVEEDSEPAFAYSNPSLRAPSMPAAVTPVYTYPQKYVTAPMGPASTQFQPVPYAAQAVVAAPVQTPAATQSYAARPVAAPVQGPIAAQSYVARPVVSAPTQVPLATQSAVARAPQATMLPAGYAKTQAQQSVPRQTYAVPKPAVKTTPAPQPVRSVPAVGDNFHAKPDSFNGQLGGKTYRKLDTDSLFGSESTSTTKVNSSTKKTRSYGQARFSSAEMKPGAAHIVQVSATMPAEADDVVFATTLDDEDYEEDYDDESEDDYRDEPVIVQVDEGEEEGYSDVEEEEEESFDDVDEEDAVEEEREEDAQVRRTVAKEEPKPTRKAESAQDSDRSTPIRGKSDSETKSNDDGVLFPNLRPFKRIRERRQQLRDEAPTPPSVEELKPENASAVEPAKEPLLTRNSDKLPPLSVKTNSAYAENADDNAADQDDSYVTKSELEATREELKGFAWQKGSLKITPYGFLNLSVSSDSQRAVSGDYMLYAQSEDVDNSSGFTVDARTSRLGLKIEAGRVEKLNADVGGTVEFDFQGYPNGSKNKGGLQLRRAFAELVDKQNDRRFLAGQEWEVISPGAPQMLNYLPAGFAGDLQYRRGQIRFEQGYTASGDLHFLTQIAACDNVLGDYTSTTGVKPASSGWPILEGRVAAEMFKETLEGKAVVVGLSGHIGEQYYKFSPIANVPMCSTSQDNSIRTWSANVDFETPLGETHKLQAEYYHGSNLSSFIGGINQGVDLYTREGIGDQGGWIALHSGWTPKAVTNVGYGFDKPDRDDLVGTSVASNGFTSARTKNEVYFTNLLYNWTANFMTGLEVSYWRTDYIRTNVSGSKPVFSSMKSGKDLRVEFTTRLSF